MKLKCHKCGYEGQPNLSVSGQHTKASCGKCNSYIKFVAYKELDADDISILSGETIKQVKECFTPHDLLLLLKVMVGEYVDSSFLTDLENQGWVIYRQSGWDTTEKFDKWLYEKLTEA